MSNNKNNVTTGKPKVGGAVFRAPISTPLPTDATTELNVAFKCLGYISEDGLTNDGSRTTQSIKAWGGDVVHVSTTDKKDDFTMTFIESLSAEVLKLVHGDSNVTGSLEDGMTVAAGSGDLEDYAYVIEMIMTGGVLKRVVLPSASVSNVAEVQYDDSDAVGYGVTLTAMADSAGNTHYEYFKKPATE